MEQSSPSQQAPVGDGGGTGVGNPAEASPVGSDITSILKLSNIVSSSVSRSIILIHNYYRNTVSRMNMVLLHPKCIHCQYHNIRYHHNLQNAHTHPHHDILLHYH